MKILVNDHSGHSFTLSLSKQLAIENNIVLHCFSKNFQSPKGYLKKLPTDPLTLHFHPLEYKTKFKKYSIVKRALQELRYAGMLNEIIASERPDIVICANTPLVAQQKILSFCRKRKIPFIFWCQDIYSVAIKNIALKKVGILGYFVAKPFEFLERHQLKKSNSIVSITEDFNDHFKKWNISTQNFIIPNWSPIKEFRLQDKVNGFSHEYGIKSSFNIIYSGTMGLKHNPKLIIELCKRLIDHEDIKMIVVSEGIGATYLETEKNNHNLKNLMIIPFQPFEKFSEVLSSADIFLALLEKDAGLYSVPSKVLSYMCAGKPIIVAAPINNLASKMVISSNSGKCIADNNCDALVKAIVELKEDKSLYQQLSKNARLYAEQNFQIENIAKLFTKIFQNN